MKAFTLIEILVVITVLVLVSLMIGFFVYQSYKTLDFIQEQAEVQDQVRNTINIISKETRKAQTAETGSYPIKEAKKLSFAFYANIDSTPEVEQVRYFLQDTDLIKGIIKPTGDPFNYSGEEQFKTVASFVRNDEDNPIFSYFDENYTGAENPLSYPIEINEITLMRINLIVDVDLGKNPLPYTLESEVSLRNLKTNL